MTKYLLDTSALLAHYRDEPGAERVQELFDDPAAAVTIASVTVTEFCRRLVELGVSKRKAVDVLGDYLMVLGRVVPVDEAMASEAFLLGSAASKRLPLADALIAASAKCSDAVLIHRDPHFSLIPHAALKQEML
jgi:predicted nucleic acid-binding protein